MRRAGVARVLQLTPRCPSEAQPSCHRRRLGLVPLPPPPASRPGPQLPPPLAPPLRTPQPSCPPSSCPGTVGSSTSRTTCRFLRNAEGSDQFPMIPEQRVCFPIHPLASQPRPPWEAGGSSVLALSGAPSPPGVDSSHAGWAHRMLCLC